MINAIYLSVISLTLIFTFCSAFVNVQLLYCTFLSKTLKKLDGFTLFYVRFGMDCLIATFNLFSLSFSSVQGFDITSNISYLQTIVFSVSWPNNFLMSARTILSIIITIDRIVAVGWPIFYHNYRGRLSNLLLICLIVLSEFAMFGLMFRTCSNSYDFPPDCLRMGCLLNPCHKSYLLKLDIIFNSIIFISSLVLTTMIFVWNNFKKSTKSKSFERANFLTLLDAFIYMVFNVTPAVLIVSWATMAQFGTAFRLFKMSGNALEAFLVRSSLRRSNKVRTNVVVRSTS